MASKQSEAFISVLAGQADFAAAARTLTDPIRQAINDGGLEEALEEKLSSSWNIIIDVAARTQYEAQGPLVETMKAVQKQRISNGERSDTVTIWGSQVKLWEDMPLFGASVREAWNRAPGTGSKDDFSAAQWDNLNAFMARLTALSPSIPAFDFSLYAIWTMRSAFEDNETNDNAIDATRMWFKYSRETIERLSHEGKNFEGPVARGGDKYRDKNWTGFSDERLAVWQTALQ